MSSGENLIVYQAPWNWDKLRTRSQPLAESLTHYATVVYIDCGTSATSRVARSFSRVSLQAIARQLVSPHVSPLAARLWRCAWSGPHIDEWSGVYHDRPRLAKWRLTKWLRKFSAGFENVWLLTSRPKLSSLIQDYPWSRVAVDVEDPWMEMQWARDLPQSDVTSFLAQADTVTANGRATADSIQPLSAQTVINLPNGVDSWLVDQLTGPRPLEPAFYRATDRKRVTYTGAVDDRLAYELLREVSTRRTDCEFYFVGPKTPHPDAEARASQERLFARSNVIHVPPQPHCQIPAILAHSDALLMPLASNGGGKMLPGKLLEYTAAAKPILSIPDYSNSGVETPSVIQCTTADLMDDVLRRLVAGEEVLARSDQVRCQQVAREATWGSRAAQLVELLRAAPVSNKLGGKGGASAESPIRHSW